MFKRLQADFDRAARSYCALHGFSRDADWIMLKLLEEVGELTQAWNRNTGRARPHGRDAADLRRDLEDEAADVLGMVLLLAEDRGLDLTAAIERKWLFRPETE